MWVEVLGQGSGRAGWAGAGRRKRYGHLEPPKPQRAHGRPFSATSAGVPPAKQGRWCNMGAGRSALTGERVVQSGCAFKLSGWLAEACQAHLGCRLGRQGGCQDDQAEAQQKGKGRQRHQRVALPSQQLQLCGPRTHVSAIGWIAGHCRVTKRRRDRSASWNRLVFRSSHLFVLGMSPAASAWFLDLAQPPSVSERSSLTSASS